MPNKPKADIQVIANVVVHDGQGSVLMVQSNPDSERWSLPGKDVEPFSHPDQTVAQLLSSLDCDSSCEPVFKRLQSFRGRRGWHLIFDYLAETDRGQAGDWFAISALPRTIHGDWEADVIRSVLKM